MTLAEAFPPYRPAIPIKGWNDLPTDIERAEIHGRVVKDFAPLLDLKHLRTLEVSAPSAAQLALLGRLESLKVLAIDHPGRDLAPLAGLEGLQALKLFAFEASTFAGIEGLRGLRYFQIDHAPKLSSLEPLEHLPQLEWLSIMTPPGWDASRKTIKVASLTPLSRLRALRYLRLMGVEPKIDGLAPLASLTQLEVLDFSHVFTLTMADYAGLAAALPQTEGDCLRPTYRLNIRTLCKKCQEAELMWLTAPPSRARAALCPKCNATKLAAHVSAFERLKAQAASRSSHSPD